MSKPLTEQIEEVSRSVRKLIRKRKDLIEIPLQLTTKTQDKFNSQCTETMSLKKRFFNYKEDRILLVVVDFSVY